jgi:glycosyltransferase involved in cell wall biosynthesis
MPGQSLMIDILIQTRNEELNLPETLRSLSGWVNKIFVVDSGSTDRTVEIAKEAGAQVVFHAWEGYAAQKNWALDNLPFESAWILILDADEAVTPALRDEIEQVVNKPPEQVAESAFHINRVFIFLGQEIRHCGYFPSWNLRLFKRGHARYERRLVHEHMIVTGKTGYLKGLLIHEDRRGLEHFIAKHNRYSTLEAQEIFSATEEWPGVHTFVTDRVTRRRYIKNRMLPFMPLPWVIRFFYMYIFRLGILDGRPGLVLCLFISSYEFFIRAKYFELKQLLGQAPHEQHGLAQDEGAVRVVEGLPLAAPKTTIAIAAPVSSPPLLDIQPPTAAPRIPMGGRALVSVMIPTLNEGKNIARCLDHLQWADEVVVVDSGSKDDTCAIAERYGARVVQFKWNGQWPKKKNWALRNVDFRNPWVLIVDADEWITPELADEIVAVVKTPRKTVGYYINRRFIFMGGWIRHCGYYPSWNLRLIKRGFGEYEQLTEIGDTGSGDNEVHEHVVCKGEVAHLDQDMLHFAFPNIQTFVEKHNRYSNWEAAVQYAGTDDRSTIKGSSDLTTRRWLRELSRKLPFRPTLRFLYSYVIKGGFLDGKPGYVFCRLLSMYEFLSVAKYYELRRQSEDQRRVGQMSVVPARPLPAMETPASSQSSAVPQ